MEEGEFSEAREDLAALEQVLIPNFLNLVLTIILIIPNFLILLINFQPNSDHNSTLRPNDARKQIIFDIAGLL